MSLLLGLCLLGGVLVAGMAFPGALALGLVAGAAGDSVNSVSTDLLTGQVPTASTIVDSAGTPIAYLFDQNREPVPAEQISPAMKAAIVAVEDRRFYQHQGVDWQGTIRALVANSASGGVVQGASTLTQQYVKNYFLYVQARTEAERLKATEQTPARKLREARIALQMERSLSKEDILARYLNIVFWGNGAYGVSAAARTYFNTTADQLTVAQAALLAGMVRSTTQFDPVANPAGGVGPAESGDHPDAGAGDDRRGAGAAGVGPAVGDREPVGHPQERVHRGGGCRVLLQVRHRLPGRGRGADDPDPARRVHDQDHPGPGRDGEDEGVVERRGPRGRGERGRRDGHRRPGPGPPPGAGDGVEPHVRARRRQTGDQLRAAVRAGQPGRRVGVQDLHHGHRDGEGAGHQLPHGGARRAATRRRSTSTATAARSQ